MNKYLSYEDASDIFAEVKKEFDSGSKLVFISIPGPKTFLECVDVKAFLRDVSMTRYMKCFILFTFSFGLVKSESPFIFVFIKKSGF